MKKRILSILMVLAVLCTSLPFSAVSVGAETSGDYEYVILDDGTAEITDYTGTATELVIPSELEGHKVTSIGERAFYDCDALTSVTIGDSVTSIGDYTFAHCGALTSIDIPDSVTSIGESAFAYCIALTSIEIPNSVISIGASAFDSCYSLTSIEIPDSVTIIGYGAFRNCDALTSIEIPNSVTIIGYGAFRNCDALTSIEIPDSVTSIGDYAFCDCDVLTSIEIPNSVTSIGYSTFDGCDALNDIHYKGTERQCEYVFRDLLLPNTVIISFDEELFNEHGFGYLIKNDKAEITSYNGDNTEIIIPNEIDGYPVSRIGVIAFLQNITLTSVDIPNSVTSIGDSAFYACDALTSVTIGDSVTSIGYAAFYGCSALTSIEIPNSVTSIGDRAFEWCKSLTSIEIPDSVTSIGDSAFFCCYALTSIEIPDSVTSIGENAFYRCSALTSIDVSESNENYSSINGVLFNKDKTELIQYPIGKSDSSYVIPDSVTSIGYSAFKNCDALTSVTIGDGVTYIGYSAFYDCYALTIIDVSEDNENYSSINGVLFNKDKTELIQYPIGKNDTSYVIPDSVTYIGAYAFEDCDALTSIEIPDSVTSIGYGAFGYCSSLTSVTIGDSVTSIGDYAFDKCGALTRIEIPNSVTSIGNGAFSRCDALTNVYHTGTEEQWNLIDFSYSNSPLTSATIHFNSSMPGNKDFELNDDTDLAISIDNQLNKNILTGILVDTPQADIISSFVNPENIQIVDKDGNILANDTKVGTGAKIQLIDNGNVVDELVVVIKGEINGDGDISTKDVTLQRRFIANWESDIIETAADVDGDGVVNAKDTALIRRYIAGWDVAL